MCDGTAILFVHRPPFTNAAKDIKPNVSVQTHIVKKLKNPSVTPLVISGHVHSFEHFNENQIHYIVSGGGGGPVRKLSQEPFDDLYDGKKCSEDDDGFFTRPFNYLLIRPTNNQLKVNVYGLCPGDNEVEKKAIYQPVIVISPT